MRYATANAAYNLLLYSLTLPLPHSPILPGIMQINHSRGVHVNH